MAPAVAVVGTRTCTKYGLDLARAFGAALTRSGWTVVSGLARGIDAAAHWGTVEALGAAVAVLGNGIDVVYPRENGRLRRTIVESGGALVSEYAAGTPPDRWRFPARNRLIAAMSSAVVVVEAGERGGALITARLAAEIGRPVLVVPGDVDRPASVGCNQLIRDGAHPVLGELDLITELELLVGPAPRPRAGNEHHDLGFRGHSLDELTSIWECDLREALVRAGRLEARGRVRLEGSLVFGDGPPESWE